MFTSVYELLFKTVQIIHMWLLFNKIQAFMATETITSSWAISHVIWSKSTTITTAFLSLSPGNDVVGNHYSVGHMH
jgi:hypothetical protein